MSNKIVKDHFEFDKSFSSFKRSCSEVPNAAVVSQLILKKLQEKGLVCSGDEPIKIADIGCGPADTIIAYLRNIDFRPGFDIRATDIDAQYVNQVVSDDGVHINQSPDKLGLAARNLLKAKCSQVIPIRNYSVKQGDIFQDNLLNLLSIKDDIEEEKNTFPLVFASHSLYYSQVYRSVMAGMTKNIIDRIATDILTDNGIAICVHTCIKPRSVGLMFYRYTYKVIQDFDPSQEECNQHSPESLIACCCEELGLPSYSIPVRAKLEFSDTVSDNKDIFKNPDRYDELNEGAIALDDLYKMLFLAHKSPNQLYQDKSQFGLTNLVDETIAILKEDGCMYSYLTLQVILSRNATAKFKKDVESVLETIKNDFI